MLARKMEVCQPDHSSTGRTDAFKGYKKYRWYPNPGNKVTTLDDEGELFHPDPDEHNYEMSEEDPFEGLNARMTQVMNHFQREEHHCFVCGQTGHFARKFPHIEAFHAWQKELKLQRDGSAPKGTHPEESTTVNAWMAGASHSTSLFVDAEMLVRLKVEGQEVDALADSSSKVNTVMPGYVSLQGCPVLP